MSTTMFGLASGVRAAAMRSSGFTKRVEAIGIPLPGVIDDPTVGFLACVRASTVLDVEGWPSPTFTALTGAIDAISALSRQRQPIPDG